MFVKGEFERSPRESSNARLGRVRMPVKGEFERSTREILNARQGRVRTLIKGEFERSPRESSNIRQGRVRTLVKHTNTVESHIYLHRGKKPSNLEKKTTTSPQTFMPSFCKRPNCRTRECPEYTTVLCFTTPGHRKRGSLFSSCLITTGINSYTSMLW